MRAPRLLLALASVAWASAPAGADTWMDGALATNDLERLESWPGAPAARRTRVQLGMAWPFLGSGLSVQSLRVQQGRASTGWAMAFEQMRSDIHLESQVTGALQGGAADWRAGLAVSVRELRFTAEPPWRTAAFRLGAGGRLWHALRGAATWQWRQDALPTLGAGAAWTAERFELSLRAGREPGLPARWRAGLAWAASPACALLCGYDVTTAAVTGGIVAGAGAWRLTWIGLAHPALGWSHTWVVEYAR